MSSLNAELKQQVEGNEEHLRILLQYTSHIKQIAISIEEQHVSTDSPEYKDDHKDVEELEKITKEFIQMREETENNINALRSVFNNPLAPNILEQKYQQEFKKHSKTKFNDKYWSENELYNKFRNEVWDVHHKDEPKPWRKDEDEDIVIESTQNTQMDVLCPIGRSIMKAPVKSKACVHVFDSNNIQQYLGKFTKTCPVAGCIAKLNWEMFSKDYETEINIKEYLKSQSTQRQEKPTISLSDEEDEDITDL